MSPDRHRIAVFGGVYSNHLALEAAAQLAADNVPTRVVNLASWDLFEAQPQEYRDEVLPPAVTARVAVEAGHSLGWERYVGCPGSVISIDRFGASAPAQVLGEQFGFTTENVVAAVKDCL